MSETEPTHNVEQAPSHPSLKWLAGIFLFALLVRLFHVLQINAEPLLGVLTNESFNYHQWATDIASGNWWGQEVFTSCRWPYSHFGERASWPLR